MEESWGRGGEKAEGVKERGAGEGGGEKGEGVGEKGMGGEVGKEEREL